MTDTTLASVLSDEQRARIVAEMNAEMDEIKAKAKAETLLKLRAWKADADRRRQEVDAAATSKAEVAQPVPQQPHASHNDHMDIDEASPMSLGTDDDDAEEGEVMEDVLSAWQPRKVKTAPSSGEASRSSSISDASPADSSKQRQTTAVTKGRGAESMKRGEGPPPSLAATSKASKQQSKIPNAPSVSKAAVETVRDDRRIPSQAKKNSNLSSTVAIPVKRASVDNSAQNNTLKKSKQVPEPSAKLASVSAGGLAGLKISKKPGTSLKKTSDRASPETMTAIAQRPPAWYMSLNAVKTRNPDESNAQVLLERLKSDVKKAKESKGSMQQTFENIREVLHKLAFEKVSGNLLRSFRALHDNEGLPQLLDASFMGGVKVPWDIRADAEELYNKWSRQIFETDLLRGIIAGKPATKHSEKSVDTIDPAYTGKVSSKFHGNGLLLNGQWWPTQLTAVRDGAHGATIAGISGSSGEGAYSCIMSGGHDYADEDHGEWVKYCGTDSTDGSVSEPTQRMLESQKSGKPVRLIRSHNLKSDFAPEIGFRYDGLYKVVSNKNLDGVSSSRQRHQFRLERLPGQDPIRGKETAKRPTEQEMEAHLKHLSLRG